MIALALSGADPLFDVVRLLLLSQAGFTLGMAALIAVAYGSLWWSSSSRRGLLPIHVVLISVAHSMLVLYGSFDIYSRLGETDITWRTPFLVVALILSDVALVVVMSHQRLRLRQLRQLNHPRRRADDL